jgi:hypothetical protein
MPCDVYVTSEVGRRVRLSLPLRDQRFLDVTPEMTVYRYSEDKLIAYLKGKVEHLATPTVSELSRTVVRELAKDGLMEDGNERLLEGWLLTLCCASWILN